MVYCNVYGTRLVAFQDGLVIRQPDGLLFTGLAIFLRCVSCKFVWYGLNKLDEFEFALNWIIRQRQK